ncbi:MAG: hypothetical protein AABX85_00225 [Nanoarchaeota archaeon]
MTIQYNVPVKVLNLSKEWLIQESLRGYKIFTDRTGNLEDICFSRENVPYVGELIVVKTHKREAAQKAYELLKEVEEGFLVLPITESDFKKDREKVGKLEQELPAYA